MSVDDPIGDALKGSAAFQKMRAKIMDKINKQPMKIRDWDIGFGPVTLKAGEKRRVDAQPKCMFTPETIHSYPSNAGVHLLALYIGRDEVLGLRGDSIDLGAGKPIVFRPDVPTCLPAMPLEIEIENRDSVERTIFLNVSGKARL